METNPDLNHVLYTIASCVDFESSVYVVVFIKFTIKTKRIMTPLYDIQYTNTLRSKLIHLTYFHFG